MILSVVCPSLLCRSGWSPILEDVRRQAQGRKVEVIALGDNGTLSIGEKMNELVRMSRGRFVAGVGDDDRVAGDYVASLLKAIQENDCDAVTFDVCYTWEGNGRPASVVEQPAVMPSRLNPLAAIRREILARFTFKRSNQGEDADLRKWLETQSPRTVHIDKVLYFAHYRHEKHEFENSTYSKIGARGR